MEELLHLPEKNTKDIHEYERLVGTHVTNKEKEEALLETLMAKLGEKTQPLLTERSKLEKKLITLRKNVNQAKATYDIALSELDLYTSVEKVEQERLKSFREIVDKNARTIEQRQKQLELLEKKIPATEHSLRQANSEMSEVKAHEVEMTAQLRRLRITFEEQRSAMQNSRSRNYVLDSLMREKREGRIAGIFGRLVSNS